MARYCLTLILFLAFSHLCDAVGSAHTLDYPELFRAEPIWQLSSPRALAVYPVKTPDDLLKLEKPVSWTTPDPRTLWDTVRATGSVQALPLRRYLEDHPRRGVLTPTAEGVVAGGADG